MDEETGNLAEIFDTSATECMCKNCGWEQVRKLCLDEAIDCPFCSGLDSAFWRARACPSAYYQHPHIDFKMWGGIAVLIVAFMAWQMKLGFFKPGQKHISSDISKFMWDDMFQHYETLTPETLVTVCEMDLHFAKGIIRKAAGGPATEISAQDLFSYLDKSKDGWLSQSELVNLLYRNYPEKTAENLAERLVLRANGEHVPEPENHADAAALQGHAQLLNSYIPGKKSPYFDKLVPFNPNRERVPSFRHLSQLEIVNQFGRPLNVVKKDEKKQEAEPKAE